MKEGKETLSWMRSLVARIGEQSTRIHRNRWWEDDILEVRGRLL